jgi:hypothetical protein
MHTGAGRMMLNHMQFEVTSLNTKSSNAIETGVLLQPNKPADMPASGTTHIKQVKRFGYGGPAKT